MTENKILWHYCSLETFFNIIKYQSIRLSDVYKSNDYLEKEGFQKLIRETIMEEYFSDKVEICENFQDFLCYNFLNSNNDLFKKAYDKSSNQKIKYALVFVAVIFIRCLLTILNTKSPK